MVDWQRVVLREPEFALGKRVQYLPGGNGHVQKYPGKLYLDVNTDPVVDW